MNLEPGVRLGPYEIVAKLGEGGMGIVYRARDPRLGRSVAIKVLPEDVAHDPERLRRFEQEARAVSALSHPNILTVYDIGTADGVVYLVTELLEGASLRDRLRQRPVSPHEAAAIAVQAARGLAAAHRRGVIHRDLKPENLWITAEGHVKILDFGLARFDRPELATGEAETRVRTSDGMVLGTVGYMSPEQARGGRADARSDVFSLGVVLHEMVTGHNPFLRGTVVESLHAVLKDEPSPAVAPGGEAGPDVAPIVARCLHKDPARRFQSASDLAFELEHVSATTAAAARPRIGARRRAWWLTAAGLTVGAVLISTYAFWRGARGVSGTTGAAAVRSLAVLPLGSLSPNAADAYFSDGMTDALTTELARLPGLTVVAGTSTARSRGSTATPTDVARALGVGALLSGSVLRADDRVRISVELTEAGSNRVIWAHSYERPLRDVLALQADVARAIAGAIALELSPAAEARLENRRPVDPTALDEYLHGRALWRRRTEESVRESLAHFEAAARIDPEFALAHTGVADAYIILAAYDWMRPLDALPLAIAAVERAEALDPAAGEPHASRGDLAIHFDRDLVRAAGELARACELSPSHAPAFHWRGEAALYDGHPHEAIAFMQRALELDPQATAAETQLALAYEAVGDAAAAERGYQHAHALSPDYEWPADALIRIDLDRGRAAAALAAAQARVDADASAGNLAMLGVALARADRQAEARRIQHQLQDLAARRWVSPYELARVEAALGQRDAMLAHLRDAVEASVFRVQAMSVVVDLEFRRYAGDPEFERIRSSIWRRK